MDSGIAGAFTLQGSRRCPALLISGVNSAVAVAATTAAAMLPPIFLNLDSPEIIRICAHLVLFILVILTFSIYVPRFLDTLIL